MHDNPILNSQLINIRKCYMIISKRVNGSDRIIFESGYYYFIIFFTQADPVHLKSGQIF
jgi:hypothetical protein